MPRRKFKVPRITTPATIYLVRWLDANYDQDYDGPAHEYASGLVTCSHAGFHTKTERDHVVLAGSSDVEDGINHARFQMTIPRIHIISMEVLRATEEPAAGKVGGGGVPGEQHVEGEVR